MHPLGWCIFYVFNCKAIFSEMAAPGYQHAFIPGRKLLSGGNSDRRHYFFLLRKKNLKLEIVCSFFEFIKIIQKNIREIDSAGIHHRSKLQSRKISFCANGMHFEPDFPGL
jgi:hypothetical protein